MQININFLYSQSYSNEFLTFLEYSIKASTAFSILY